MAGSTLLQVKERITQALKAYVDAPAVYVLLVENRSKKIYIQGQVNLPGEYVLVKQMTVLQALALAGGFAGVGRQDGYRRYAKGAEGADPDQG